MRLFIGVELSDVLMRTARDAANDLRKALSRVAPRTVLRWVEPSNLHITLWFLGEVAEERTSDVTAVLRDAFQTSAFALRIGGAGMFPQTDPPRALWFGIRAGGDALRDLHSELEPRLARLGFQPEKRAYSAHLTIARFKDVRRADIPAIRKIVAGSAADIGECDITAVTLFRSRLSPSGSRYEHLLRVPLA
jgi:2'-5' RNA ligase